MLARTGADSERIVYGSAAGLGALMLGAGALGWSRTTTKRRARHR